MKLTPNSASPAAVAEAADEHGADAVSLINTLRAMALDPRRPGEPWLGGGTGGVSGPAVRAVALAQVAEVASGCRDPGRRDGRRPVRRSCARPPGRWSDVVAVGTESFRDPLAGAKIADGLAALVPNIPAKSGVPDPATTGPRAPISHRG